MKTTCGKLKSTARDLSTHPEHIHRDHAGTCTVSSRCKR